MSSRAPSGTFTNPPLASGPTVGVSSTRAVDKARFCGCCCRISRRALLLILAALYQSIAILSLISVGGGVTAHMTDYHGQFKVSSSTFMVTSVTTVGGKPLQLWTGWLKFNNGMATNSTHDLTDLSNSSGALGYLTAFILLVSAIIALWKVMQISLGSYCGPKSVRSSSVFLGISLSVVMLLFLASFYAITSRDIDSLAHASLSIPSTDDISMKPDYAWYCGLFAACIWTLVSVFSCGMPIELSQEYHHF